MLTWDEFSKADIRVGTIVDVQDFPKARQPSYQLTIDFGELGTKKSSAQLVDLYAKDDLVDRQIIAVVNFPPKQIANFMSECLVLGVIGDQEGVVLLQPDRKVVDGLKIS